MPDIVHTIQYFLVHFLTGLALTVAFVVLYAAVTPQAELKLVRAGNAAAALEVGGAALGFVIPMALVLTLTSDPLAAAGWGAVSLVVQLLGLALVRLLIPRLASDIAEGRMSAATVQAVVSVGLGLLQAASWAP